MCLVRKRRILTKDQLLKIGWQGDDSCIFCGLHETIDHLLVSCSFTRIFWDWIVSFNNFTFRGQSLEDLWIMDCCIPLKDKLLVELITSTVCWVL
jgi:zinc-binding in reverse transcriptase